jgi:hypothetical protein
MARRRGLPAALVAAFVASLAVGAPASASHPAAPTGDQRVLRSAPGAADRDLIVTARSSTDGYQLYAARADERWAWRPLASIQPAGNTAEPWIGYHCVTGDGRYVVAVVAPRHAANVPVLRDRGALAYVVRVRDGRVRPLVAGVALKYHDPGCGQSRRATLTRNLGSDQAATEVLVADLPAARVARRLRVRGQVTSVVPTRNGIVGSSGRAIVKLTARGARRLAVFDGQPYLLRSAGRAVDLLVAGRHERADAWRVTGRSKRWVASGRLGHVRLFKGRAGRNVLVGADRRRAAAGLSFAAAPRGQARTASLDGGVVLSNPPRRGGEPRASAAARRNGALLGKGAPEATTVLTDAKIGRAVSIGLPPEQSTPVTAEPRLVVARAAANTTTPKCAVPRNNLRRQVRQPSAAQVDWAIQQATRNLLKGTVLTRPADYANMQLAAYQPSVDFPRADLHGWPGKPVPPSVIQGVFAQESAWLHASRRALPGVSGNPSISDYYGSVGTLDTIDYDKADCGYGLSQVTDYMTAASTFLSANGKAKVAVDYAENAAIGITFLVNKWNELYDAGVTVNNADPDNLENWYLATWAYNSGFHANTGSGPWGLGWTNNPQNADYPPDRQGFLRATYADAEHPADWPYQERVIGWMETPIVDYKGNPSYAKPVDANGTAARLRIPAASAFCTAANECSPTYRWPGDPSKDYCMRADRQCWWHSPVTYASCPTQCAKSLFTVSTTATEPAGIDNYPPQCSSILPSGTVIVDDQPSNLNVEGCGSSNWSSQGTFSVSYGKDGAGVALGQIDWHQLGTGFGGHTWFTKNQPAGDTAHINTGTWTPPSLNGTYNIKVHVPANGASTSYAKYVVHRGDDTTAERVIDQHLHENRWVSLGTFTLQPGAKVVLDNVTPEQDERVNVAFDAVAFTQVSGTPVRKTVDATTTFDTNQNMDSDLPNDPSFIGAFDFKPFNNMRNIYDWALSWSDVAAIPPCVAATTTACIGTNTRVALLGFRSRVVAAGPAHQDVEPADTMPKWLGFANPDPPPALTDTYLADRGAWKVRARLKIEFLQNGGRIDPGSLTVTREAVTGDTHMSDVVLQTMRALRDDYGIAMPNLAYSAKDLNLYTHGYTNVDPVTNGGILPGRAYKDYMSQPVLTDNGTCARVEHVMGGSIGLKPMNHVAAVRNSVAAWRDRAQQLVGQGRAPQVVANAAQQIYRAFYRQSELSPIGGGQADTNSPFYLAPPIWIQQDVKVCTDGSVRPGRDQIAYSSYMPDLYLWVDGQPADFRGQLAAGPVQRGDFLRFSHPSDELPLSSAAFPGDPWDACQIDPGGPNFESRRDGQPWSLQQLTHEDQTPTTVRFCDGDTYWPPEYHSDP